MQAHTKEDIKKIYDRRFGDTAVYRNRVWSILCREFFSRYIPSDSTVLDLGCGYGEFINNIAAGRKYGMDLNPDARKRLAKGITFLEQDCSAPWPLEPNSLDCVFTSNFFEHLPSKNCLSLTLLEAFKALKPGGRLIAMGPNIKYLPGSYWDFYDHHVIITELSLSEAMQVAGFDVLEAVPRFLPYTLVKTRPVPDFLISLYLKLPFFWPLKGRQFLVVATKH